MANRLSSGPEGAHLDRLTTIQHNVRSMLLEIGTPAGSSVYERSPQPDRSQENGRPRPSPRELFGQVREPLQPPPGRTFLSSTSSPNLDLHVSGMTYSPATQPSEWSRTPLIPAPVASPAFRHPADNAFDPLDPQRDLEAAAPRYPRGHRKRRKRRQRQAAWVRENRRRNGSATCIPLAHGHTRMKFMAVVISALFLACIGTIYLTLNLTMPKTIPQELHILFILAILGMAAFCVHSLIRLWIIARKGDPRSRSSRRHNRIPSTAGPEGFKPNRPIPVQLARDEEIAAIGEDGTIQEEKLEALKQPPPAYGLWRESVRIDPNLLHWHRVRDVSEADATHRAAMQSQDSLTLATNFALPRALGNIREEDNYLRAPQSQQPRPPSYVSDDGVSYIVSALPGRPPSEIHPALRIRLP